ncbi:MAG: phosphatidylinositol alpha-1,6-mannosyltransferase [Actinobacteria bacterium]|nr:phosphatidylinositol alpha-1,6-mannosyltransferase [Actinomycetota bacterium]
MKDILFVTNDFGPRAGGIESFIIGLVQHANLSPITVYTSSQGDTREYDESWQSDYGVKVIRDSEKILLPTPRVSRSITRVIKELETEVVVFGAAAPLAIMSAACRRAGAKKILALTHGHEVWWSKVFPFTLIMRRIGSTTDALTYLGEFTRRAISRSLTSRAASAMVKIAPGIDTEHFSPVDSTELKTSMGLSGKRVIVSVGRLVHRKGQDKLIESMPSIIQEIPNAHLLLVGEGPYRKHLMELVRKHHLEDFVTFIGRIQFAQLPSYICCGEIFAMPSRSRFAGLEVEGLGIVYLEASACGLPVIAGASGGAPDAVIDGVTGVVVDGLDTEAIAKEAVKLLNNPTLAREMGVAGREWVEEKWRWQIWADEFAKLLRY